MAAISGINGLLSVNGTSAIATVRDWDINPSNAVVAGAASNSGGAQFNLRGVSDFSGSFNIYGPSCLGVVVPGTAYILYGQTGGGGEVKGGIIIDSAQITCDIEAGGILSAAVNFSSIGSSTAVYTADNAALAYQAATSLTNTTTPTIQSSLGCKAMWGPVGQSVADVPAVRSWNLTLTSENQSLSHSGAGGVTKRVRGLKSAAASIQFYEGALADFDEAATNYQQGTAGVLRLHTDATLYWLMNWGIVTTSPISTPIESAGMVTTQMDFAWTAYTDISGTITKGTIVDPNSVAFFS